MGVFCRSSDCHFRLFERGERQDRRMWAFLSLANAVRKVRMVGEAGLEPATPDLEGPTYLICTICHGLLWVPDYGAFGGFQSFPVVRHLPSVSTESPHNCPHSPHPRPRTHSFRSLPAARVVRVGAAMDASTPRATYTLAW